MTQPDNRLLALQIHAALPQTQCTRCGYPDCMAYAEAIAQGDANINQCPPGGSVGVARLAAITGQSALPLNPANGLQAPRSVAVIDEAWCIGCTLCLPVCPTDAILGSNKMMHTVIEPHCTGCELCIAVCPVDCISLENVTGELTGWAAWSKVQADEALARYSFHSCSRTYPLIKTPKIPPKTPLKTAQNEPQKEFQNEPDSESDSEPDFEPERTLKQSIIEAALAKSRALRT